MMKEQFSTIARRVALGSIIALALAGCQQQDADDVPDPAASESPAGGSIIRPEAETTSVEVALEPLDITIPMDGVEDDEMPAATRDAIAELLDAEQLGEGGAITLRGHSDSAGSGDANMRASQARAEIIQERLLEADVAPDRISIIAFGEQNPVEPNALPDGSPNEAGRAANRRVEVHVAVPGEDAEVVENTSETADL